MSSVYKCVAVLLIHLAIAKAINQLGDALNNNIQTTEEILRTAINNIFKTLNLIPNVTEEGRIKQLVHMYNYLAEISMREHEMIREMEKIVNSAQNITKHAILHYKINLNEIISETQSDDDDNITHTSYNESASDIINGEHYNFTINKDDVPIIDIYNEYKKVKDGNLRKKVPEKYLHVISRANDNSENVSNEILFKVWRNFEKLTIDNNIYLNASHKLTEDVIYKHNESSSDHDDREFEKSLFQLIVDKLNVYEMIKLLVNVKNESNKEIFDKSNVTMESNQFWVPIAADDTETDEIGQNTRRLYKKGSKTTKIRKFPFIVAVQIMGKFSCAGSIIHADLIITAASCLQIAWNNRFFRENPKFLQVRVGSDYAIAGGELMSVLEVYFHPAYTPKTLKHNLAIMRLAKFLILGQLKRVKKIGFDRHSTPLPINTEDVLILGWGARSQQNMADPWRERLQYAELPIYPHRECEDVYSRDYISNQVFCAGYMTRGGGACNNDVGAPGVIHGQLVGVVSFGSPVCGAPDTPTVFTKVGFYTDWIEDIMKQNVPTKRQHIFNTIETTAMSKTSRVPTTTTPKNAPIFDEDDKVVQETNTEEPTTNPEDNILRQFINILSKNNEFLNENIPTSPPQSNNKDYDNIDTRFEILDKYSDDDDRETNKNRGFIIQEPKRTTKFDKTKRKKNRGGYNLIKDNNEQNYEENKPENADVAEYDQNVEGNEYSKVAKQQKGEVNYDYLQNEQGIKNENSQLRSEHSEHQNTEIQSNLDDIQYEEPFDESYEFEKDNIDPIKQLVYNDNEEGDGMSVEMMEATEDNIEDFPIDYDGMEIAEMPYDDDFYDEYIQYK